MKKDDVFEFPGDREAGIIGTATRTRRVWKRNGNLRTIKKELGAHRLKVRCPQDDHYLALPFAMF